MNQQDQDNQQNTGGEENRYNETDKQKQPHIPVNKEGIEEDTSAIYMGNSTLQSPAEFKSDKEGDHSKEDEEITVSSAGDQTSTINTFAGDQSAENAVSDDESTNLNKGLDDQEIEKY